MRSAIGIHGTPWQIEFRKRKKLPLQKRAHPFPAGSDFAALSSTAGKFLSGAAAARTMNSHFKRRLRMTSGFTPATIAVPMLSSEIRKEKRILLRTSLPKRLNWLHTFRRRGILQRLKYIT